MLKYKIWGDLRPSNFLNQFCTSAICCHTAIDINNDTYSVNKNSIDAKKHFRILIDPEMGLKRTDFEGLGTRGTWSLPPSEEAA